MIDEVASYNDRKRLLNKLQHFAKTGFRPYEGEKRPIRHEWDGVYRIAHKPDTLFRICGFYEDELGKTSFIAMDAFTKKGKKLTQRDRDRINDVVRIKNQQLWQKSE